MHQCLQVPEISGSIVECLERKDAFHLALTSTALLEPSLNQIWRKITSFKPLIACLPPDIWREETAYTPDEDDDDEDYSYTLLHLRRVLSAKHLCRYLTYYAPRIRGFSLDIFNGMTLPSMETLRALELLTAARPGALSPHLKGFTWYDRTNAWDVLGEDVAKHLPPSMFLFLGGTVELLDVASQYSSACLELIEQFFTNSGFVKLKYLSVKDLPLSFIPHLANIPQLETLRIVGHSEEEIPVPPPVTGFASLHTLFGWSRQALDWKHILQCLSANNAFETLQWEEFGDELSCEDYQNGLNAITERCNPLTFTRLSIWKSALSTTDEEAIEMEDPSQLDVSPLFAFGNLVHMIIQLHVSILVTPSIVAKIPTTWPQLQSLVLSQRCSTSHVPLVTHKHVLQLTRDLPRLRELGLRFDATRIPEPSEQLFASGASRLRILRVGGSPICSPARTVVYLQSNFPFLDVLDISYSPRPSEGNLFVQRWKAVKNQWEASRIA
ncbi:hypothetical protein NMY22_g6288 [Coprinellus aureogranulatus]|nr:hypothetical protein NMY22_g6288 [Coprinellus aureogranulatus]